MALILIVEDEQDLADLLVYNLKAEGHETEVANTGASALSRARARKPDLVLLDLMLPDISGYEVIRMMKADPLLHRTSVVMVTARAREHERIQGFELGADDYVVKPFVVKELMLRIKAVLRRMDADTRGEALLRAGEIELDPSRHEVKVKGQSIVLTALEFRLLKTLLERPDRVQTREVLLADVWGIEAEIMTRTVDTHIKRLREKLGPPAEIIETVRGVGYKLVPPA